MLALVSFVGFIFLPWKCCR